MIALTYITIFASAVLFLAIKFSYWKRKGVKFERPFSPFGTISPNVLQRKSMADVLDRLYKKFNNEPYFGIFTFLQPALVVTDPYVMKQIFVKDYDTFIKRKLFSTNDPDQPFSKSLISTSGNMWKRVRPSLSPAFTTTKVKNMYSLIEECAKQWLKSVSENKEDVIDMDIRNEILFRFTTDVNATCVFGLESNSFKNKCNEFLERARKMGDFVGIRVFSMFGYCFNKYINKLFNLSIVSESDAEFFSNIITKTIKLRKEKGVERPDLVHLLIQAQQKKLTHDAEPKEEDYVDLTNGDSKNIEEITDDDIVGHSLLFLIAGSDTTAIALNFLCYELAVNPNAQNKLYQEIADVTEGKFSYDNIQELKYLDMCIHESFRKWPPLPVFDRCTVRPYTINLPDRTPLHLETGSIVWVPIFSIQRDERYFPNPESFIPERFNKENKSFINKDVYMPFGAGPRMCLGFRLAMLMMKIIMVHIVYNFEIVQTEKTPHPMVLSKKHIFLNPNTPMFVGLKRRVM